MQLHSSKLNQAHLKHQSGDLEGAVDLYREVLAEDPRNPEALLMMGAIAQQHGNSELALKLIEASLASDNKSHFAWYNRALILRKMNRIQESFESVHQAVTLEANYPEAWNFAGILARETKQLDRAKKYHARAIALRPADLKLQADYALALLAANDLPAAYEIMHKVEEQDPTIAPLTMANILKNAGYPERALPYMSKARSLAPQQQDMRLNEASAFLQMGRYDEGWRIFEERQDLDARFYHLPLWRGEAVDHLLVYEDQGMGDTLQTVRYLSLLKERAERITLQIARPLVDIVAYNFPTHEIIGLDQEIPLADARVRFMSLPHHFNTTLEQIPFSDTFYLRAPEKTRAFWRQRLKDRAGPRIGIVWGGNPHNINDDRRSIPFEVLEPLFEPGRGHLISLQKGEHRIGCDLGSFDIIDADQDLSNFSETAGLMSELDLVITTCTSTAHLAGALGVPAWVLLAFDPHWLWLLGREDSPWYPSLRLFRQKTPRDWENVMTRVSEELVRFLSGDKTVQKPPRWQGAPVSENPYALKISF